MNKNVLSVDEQIKQLSNNYKNIIPRQILKHFPKLDWGNNGIGDRWANGKQNYTVIYSSKNKDFKTYSDNDENIDIDKITSFRHNNKKATGIIGIWPHSIKTEKINRSIDQKISSKIKSSICVLCGSRSQLTCDHKNDLYNDSRVLDKKTQVIDDFQCLCNHCNLQKRQISKTSRETKTRYAATNIPMLKNFGIDFIEGDEKLDFNDKNAMVGTFWYDPVRFINYIHTKLKNKT